MINYLNMKAIVIPIVGLLVTSGLAGCTYRMGTPDRMIPGGYRQLSVPIFKNMTQETGIEVAFTNAIVNEFERSRTARVVDAMHAEAQVDGEIVSLQYQAQSGDNASKTLPRDSVLKTTYQILINVKVTLRRRADQQILWESMFKGERTYTSAQVTQFGVNTVNPLYNLSARRQNIEVIAADMMAEAHDRMSESF